jgi:hypothetical protein
MFEERFARIPTDPPRRAELLPGLRLTAIVPRTALFLPLMFVGVFALIPLSIMNSDPAMKLAMRPTHIAQGHVVSVAEAQQCSGSGAHRFVYAFSPEPGREFRGAATLCRNSPYIFFERGRPSRSGICNE